VSVYVIVLAALLVTAVTIKEYFTEITNLVWHGRHGFHAELGGIRVRIPLSYEAEDPHGLPSLLIMRLSSHLWRGSGFINIDFRKQPTPEAMQAAEAMLPKGSVGVKRTKVGERTAVFAGRQGTCVEFIPEIDNSLINKLIRERDIRDIDCRFGSDLSVRFMGSVNLKSDFYNVIQTAESVKGTK
jgi:hypothetical protein